MSSQLRLLILSVLIASISACLPKSEDDTSQDRQTVTVQITNKAGVPYPNIRLEARNGQDATLATADSTGTITYTLAQTTYQLISGGSVPSRPYIYAHDSTYEGQINVSSGTSAYTAVFREAVFLDDQAVHSTGTQPTITTETQFAVAITLSAQVNFCSAGIGILFGGNYLPSGSQISIHTNNSGEPNPSSLLTSTTLSHSELMVPTDRVAGGMTGNFCNTSTTVQTLSAGTYWIVATFATAPNACASGHCFEVLGTTSANASGLPVKVSSDGGTTWTTRTFTAGGETRQSLSAFLLE